MTDPPLQHIASLAELTGPALRTLWPAWFDSPPPAFMRRELLARALAYRMQERASGGLSTATRKKLQDLAHSLKANPAHDVTKRPRLTPGTRVIRQWGNEMHEVTVEAKGFLYRGTRYKSLSEIARTITGTRWSGPVFFGVKQRITGEASVRDGN